MTYNPDEIAKVKHLNEFVRQLTKKLDGTTEQLDRSLSLTFGTNYNFDLTQDSINIPLSAIDSSAKTISGSIQVPTNDTSKLIVSDLSNLTFQWNQITYRADSSSQQTNFFSWRFVFSQTDTPFSASVKFFLPENDTYKEWQKNITLNFVKEG